MPSQLVKTTSAAAPATRPARRPRALTLETQSAYKFGLAVAIGAGILVVGMPAGVAVLLTLAAVVLAARSLAVLATDPRGTRMLRVREIAHYDGAMSVGLAFIAVIAAASGAHHAAFIAGASAVLLALLRLATRYTA